MKTLLALLLTPIVSQAAVLQIGEVPTWPADLLVADKDKDRVVQHKGDGFYTTIIVKKDTYFFQYTYDVDATFTFPNKAYVYDYKKKDNKVTFETFTSDYKPIWDKVTLDCKTQYTWCPGTPCIPEPSTLMLLGSSVFFLRRNRTK